MKTRLLFIWLCAVLSFRLNAQTVPTPDHVVVLIMENHGYDSIIANTSAPYINSLAVDSYAALFTNSLAVTHPSQPNYLYLFSGSSQNVIGDLTPFSFQLPFTTANLGAELLAANKTFSGYSEDLPYPGFNGDTYNNYARKHAPWVNWQGTSANGIPLALALPFDSFPSNYNNLPTLSFVVPNLQDDMHDGTIKQGDTWVQTHMDAYIQWAKTHNSLLILTFDEDENAIGNSTPITTIFIGQMVKMGQYNEQIDHNRVLRTMEDMYGLTYAGASSTPAPITDCWVYKPVSKLVANPLTICHGQSIAVADSSANSPTSWTWSFPGGSPSTATGQTPPAIRYDTSGTYDITLVTYNHMGFDTLTKSAYVTVNPGPSLSLSSDSVTICQGDTTTITASGAATYSWLPAGGMISSNNNVLLAAPSGNATYLVTGNTNGCQGDTIMANVLVSPSVTPSVNISASPSLSVCSGSTVVHSATPVNGGNSPVYQWQVNGVNIGGNSPSFSIIADSSYSVNCIITSNATCPTAPTANSNVLNVLVNQQQVSSINTSICAGGTYSFKGQNISNAGMYMDTLTSIGGCDSIVTLTLSINPPLTSAIQAGICPGGAYFFKGQNLNAAGTYVDTLFSNGGCDSIVTLNLTVNQTLTSSSTVGICSGSTYTFNGQALSSAGTYHDTMQAQGGCDSIVVLNLAVNPLPTVNWGNGSDTVYTSAGPITLTGALPSGGTYSGTGVSGGVFYPDSVIPGFYMVAYAYTDGNGCSNSSDKTFVVIGTGINGIRPANSDLVLYPNPAKDQLIVHSYNMNIANCRPVIFDLTGRLMPTSATQQTDGILIDINSFESGVYWIKVNVHGETFTRKFVKAE